MKFLVLGATGMAGHTISLYLHEKEHDVTAFSTSSFPFCKNINRDAMDKAFVISMLQEASYDVVINCIGILNEACDKEPSRAVYLNSYLPHLIADTLKDTNTKLIHMSTDCVFSGKSGPYSEKSFRDGETFYDRTKALGEVEDDKNLTFRNSTINGYTKAIWTGVTTLTLAKAMERAAIEGLTGIYNLVNNKSISKFDLLKLFNQHMKADAVNIDKSLVNNRKDFSFEVPDYEQMVIEMKEWIDTHKELYHYY